MDDFDTAPHLQKTIDVLTGELGSFTDGQLKALHDAESASDKPRAGMVKAIHAEQSARAHNAAVEEVLKFAQDKGVRIYTDNDMSQVVEALKNEHGDRISSLEAALLERDGATPAKAKDPEPRMLSLTGEAEAPYGRIAFSDDQGMTLADLPELEFGPGAFEQDRARRRVILTQPIVFPESARRTEVSKVWLLGTNGKAVAFAQMVTPLAVGGGSRATIPAGHLAFNGVADAPTA